MQPPKVVIELDRHRTLYFSAWALAQYVEEANEMPSDGFLYLQRRFAMEPEGAQVPEPRRLLRFLTLALQHEDRTLRGKDAMQTVGSMVDRHWIAKGGTYTELATLVLRAGHAVGQLVLKPTDEQIADLEERLAMLRQLKELQDAEAEAKARAKPARPGGDSDEEGDRGNAVAEPAATTQVPTGSAPGSEI